MKEWFQEANNFPALVYYKSDDRRELIGKFIVVYTIFDWNFMPDSHKFIRLATKEERDMLFCE